MSLYVENQISKDDSDRQMTTAQEIFERLKRQPGIILADEVGMGKTFVALAVGVATYLENDCKNPIVIMVPSSISGKWESDFNTFVKRCILDKKIQQKLRCGIAAKTEDLLKFFDDPKPRRNAIVFLNHGAMSRGLSDPWIKYALIKRALKGRKNIDDVLKNLYRFIPNVLDRATASAKLDDPEKFWERLFCSPVSDWKDIINKFGFYNEERDYDPVPAQVVEALELLQREELDNLFNTIVEFLPKRESDNTKERLKNLRTFLQDHLLELWNTSVTKIKLKSPLLIMDEAHHLKNAKTKIAKLFQTHESQTDIDAVTKGYFSNVFDRMLFLTATPFQLGHHELINVLDRFNAINWKSLDPEFMNSILYKNKLDDMRASLDLSQSKAISLDRNWGRLNQADVELLPSNWWCSIEEQKNLKIKNTIDIFIECQIAMKDTEEKLKPWVIRHLRPREIKTTNGVSERRAIFNGEGILNDITTDHGIEVSKETLLPFLLATRACANSPQDRPVFSEGLASSYEAFLDTRKKRLLYESSTDEDDDPNIIAENISKKDDKFSFYIDQIENALNRNNKEKDHRHPKVDATVEKAFDLWLSGEKVLIFCHYIETGKTLRRIISKKINFYIIEIASEKLSCKPEKAVEILEKIAKAIDDQKSIILEFTERIFAENPNINNLHKYKETISDIVRKMIRSNSFIVRYISLEDFKDNTRGMAKGALLKAFEIKDKSDLSFYDLILNFLKFISCREEKAEDFFKALGEIQTGGSLSVEQLNDVSTDNSRQHENPTVKLVNGATSSDDRFKLMLGFNTPFFPEILIASAVMSEGVDLHLNCRYVIHHDLNWNPSSLEQRNGRVDRIGAKVEECKRPIHIYYPYVAATQDEKMFKVVMDRERWFKVVMGDKVKIDSLIESDKHSERIPFPEEAAQELVFKLDVYKIHD